MVIYPETLAYYFPGLPILELFDYSIEASSDKYSCRKVDDIYGVYSRTVRGYMRLLNFKRDVSPTWSIVNRCETIAQRFQRFSDNGLLKFIGSGEVNQ